MNGGLIRGVWWGEKNWFTQRRKENGVSRRGAEAQRGCAYWPRSGYNNIPTFLEVG